MKKFLDKKVQQVNILDERFYTLDNKTFYPSVTTVLSAYPKGYGFEEWLRNNGQNTKTILAEAGEQGSNVHNAIDEYLKGVKLTWINEQGNENYTLLEWQMICRFMEFFAYVDKKDIESEQILFSNHFKLGGTTDLVCTIDGERWMIDYKTSNAMYPTYRLQLAIYKQMYEMITKETIDRYGVLWLKANTRTNKGFMQGKGWQLKEYTDSFEKDLRLFGHTRALWDEENPNYKPKNLQYPNNFEL